MRVLVLSDIHANLPALDAVLSDAEPFSAILCIGDLVGYGPDPNECIARIREFEHVSVIGNHDQAALGQLSLDQFNQDARVANYWTRQQLTPESIAYLETLPKRLRRDDFTIVHGSPREPIWEYLLDIDQAVPNFTYFQTPFCLVGHTHIPVVFILDEEQERYGALHPSSSQPLPIDLINTRMILNPGSVGQPRDGDPRASYALLDLETATWNQRRVVYPVEETQARMRAHDLPPRLIARLATGR